ncbi:MucB/RseB C-terminal domain-containing protein [Hydrocarboniclastica marina]|nr:MucB/RseB C-terminal domain-containing protein [Hydrocarboniclastica marina]
MKTLQSLIVRKFWVMVLSLACSWAVADESGPAEARQWLEGLDAALEKTSYRGVFVYTRGSEVNAMRIVHRYRDGQIIERLSQLDGGDGEIVRYGDQIICVLPDHGRLELGALLPAGPLAGAFNDRLEPMSRWYRPEKLENGKVAGFEAVVVAVSARDRHRYSYRLWLERQTGLLLKSQVRDQDGKVLERFQFTQLEITDAISDDELTVQTAGRELRRLQSSKGGRQQKSSPVAPESAAAARPESAEGRAPAHKEEDLSNWHPTWTPAGFIARSKAVDGARRLTTYSDGIASFSVFVEPVGSMTMPLGASTIGATTAYLHKLTTADTVHRVTVVGEIPPETAMRVAESVSVEEAAIDAQASVNASDSEAGAESKPPESKPQGEQVTVGKEASVPRSKDQPGPAADGESNGAGAPGSGAGPESD